MQLPDFGKIFAAEFQPNLSTMNPPLLNPVMNNALNEGDKYGNINGV